MKREDPVSLRFFSRTLCFKLYKIKYAFKTVLMSLNAIQKFETRNCQFQIHHFCAITLKVKVRGISFFTTRENQM